MGNSLYDNRQMTVADFKTDAFTDPLGGCLDQHANAQ